MKNIFLLLSAFVLLVSCGNEPASQEANGDNQKPAHAIEQADVFLLCQEVTGSDNEAGTPANEVFLQLADSKVKVADILDCETLAPDQFEQYQIPENAISAVGGWWAGAGGYLYVVEENGSYVVKQGEMYEEKEDNNYGYKTVAVFSKKGEPEN